MSITSDLRHHLSVCPECKEDKICFRGVSLSLAAASSAVNACVSFQGPTMTVSEAKDFEKLWDAASSSLPVPTIEFKKLTVSEAREYEKLWYTIRCALPCLTESETSEVISICTGICSYCYESEKRCHCMNDE